MNLILKSLSGEKMPIEVDFNFTVEQLKMMLEPRLSIPASQLRLVISGRIVENSHSLNDYGVQDNTQVLYMQVHPKTVVPQDDLLLVGEKYEALLQRLVDSGYERPLAIAALREADSEAQAREILEKGMQLECDEEENVSESANPLSFLLNDEAFLQVRRELHKTPGLITTLLDHLQLHNPALFLLVAQYSDALQELLDAPEEESSLSDDDLAVLNKLTALGFSEEEALTAYLRSGRDEVRATRLLLESNFHSI